MNPYFDFSVWNGPFDPGMSPADARNILRNVGLWKKKDARVSKLKPVKKKPVKKKPVKKKPVKKRQKVTPQPVYRNTQPLLSEFYKRNMIEATLRRRGAELAERAVPRNEANKILNKYRRDMEMRVGLRPVR